MVRVGLRRGDGPDRRERRRAGWCASSDAPRRPECTAGSLGALSAAAPAHPSHRAWLGGSGEQRRHEGVRVEREEVADLLPHPDEPDRDARGRARWRRRSRPWPSNRASSGRSRSARPPRGTPWPGGARSGRSSHRGRRASPARRPGSRLSMIRRILDSSSIRFELRVEAAGRVGDDEVGAAGDRRIECVVDDRARVGAGRVGDHLARRPGRPRSGAGRSRRRGTCRRRRG